MLDDDCEVSRDPIARLRPGKPVVNPAPGTIDFPVIGIGASAGGLEACTKFLDALGDGSTLALILVQHLDPKHKSLLTELLAGHTSLTVLQATDGMAVQRNHLYIIPPACFLAIADGALRLTPSQPARGARLPFDFLLQSMARACGARAVCLVLSGSGADGAAGLRAIKQHGGLVIAQQPEQAEYSGMPRSAIGTGAVDLVLAVEDMPQAIFHRQRGGMWEAAHDPENGPDYLPEIIELLRTRTSHDFTLYKPGTLQRRVERRMAVAAMGGDMKRYIATLKRDPAETEQLAKDLLIHVTSFFRDSSVFEVLQTKIIPEIVLGRTDPLRVWVPGCSTGEEAYTLAMLFLEQIAAASSSTKLQIFASDADADAVVFARDGLYPASSLAELGAPRVARFFIKEEHGFRVLPELRAAVVFTVQDVLTDPPFSRVDLVSCRNLMIYLGPDAQRRVIALFHFALKQGGILLLGNAESVGAATDRFEVVSKAARIYRHIGRSRPGDVDFAKSAKLSVRVPGNTAAIARPSRQAVLAAFCQAHALHTHGPATVLSNRKHECLYLLGPTERYLRMASGHATFDLLSMVHEDLRGRLRSAILRAIKDDKSVTVKGGRTTRDGNEMGFDIEVHPVRNDEEDLLVIYFIDQSERATKLGRSSIGTALPTSRLSELEQELRTTQAELQGAILSLEVSGDEQKAITENALSANEEFQSTNEELLTSKEELQSLNEELTALNSQLQETLEQQRTTSNDLQNVLFSTDVATLFLDPDLKIRFFTPATQALFKVIKTDLGRPLEDLRPLAIDNTLTSHARAVLAGAAPMEHEIHTASGVWCRRILPYRTHDGAIEGVVVTFTDITDRIAAALALETARREAELANAAKSRFLAAASHDLRQPLQTLSLLQGLLASRVQGTASDLVTRLENTIGAMSGMLNALLDVNQIEAGIVEAEMADFRIGDLLDHLQDAFSYQAQAQGLDLRVIPCSTIVHSDSRLLEQMVRNLVSNAMNYTKQGKVLVGCRHSAGTLRIEVWDTGIGIAEAELSAIFEEYHQLGNAAPERSRGLGLGLSIVQRLGVLLKHRIRVSSRPGRGSMFSIELSVSDADSNAMPASSVAGKQGENVPDKARLTAEVLVTDDDPDVRELLTLILSDHGHRVTAVPDGSAALDRLQNGSVHADIVLSDYNLPDGMDGLAVVAAIRKIARPDLPAIILTGDTSAGTMRCIAENHCLRLAKPVKPTDLKQAIQTFLKTSAGRDKSPTLPLAAHPRIADEHVIFLVDDDSHIRDTIRQLLEKDGRTVEDFATGEAFLAAYHPGSDGCLLIDAYLPGMGGLELLQTLRASGDALPAIMITGSSDVAMAVQAMKAGAADFIEKPIAAADLLASIAHALERSADSSNQIAWQDSAADHIAELTPRQHQIMDLVLAGHPSKNIAADLGISQRTVGNHRASIMKTTGAKSMPALARLALAAAIAWENRADHTDGPAPRLPHATAE